LSSLPARGFPAVAPEGVVLIATGREIVVSRAPERGGYSLQMRNARIRRRKEIKRLILWVMLRLWSADLSFFFGAAKTKKFHVEHFS